MDGYLGWKSWERFKGYLGLSHVLHQMGLGPHLASFTPQLLSTISFPYSQGRDDPFAFMNVAFPVLGYMLAVIIIFCFTVVRVFQLATL